MSIPFRSKQRRDDQQHVVGHGDFEHGIGLLADRDQDGWVASHFLLVKVGQLGKKPIHPHLVIRITVLPHWGQMPLIAWRPFFNSTRCGFWIVTVTLSLTQY